MAPALDLQVRSRLSSSLVELSLPICSLRLLFIVAAGLVGAHQSPGVNGAGNRKQATAQRVSRTVRFASTAGSTTRPGRRRRRSPTSSRRSRPKAPRRPTRWRCGSSTTTTRSTSARGCHSTRRPHPGAARPPRQHRPGRAHPGVARHVSRPPHRGRLRRDRRRRAHRSLSRERQRGDASTRASTRSGAPKRSVSGDGWTAELWIPFSQLRFNPRTDLAWGLNMSALPADARRSRTTGSSIPRTVRAWSSRFGDLRGIAGVVPPRRIEALPYVAGASTVNGAIAIATIRSTTARTSTAASAPTSRWASART